MFVGDGDVGGDPGVRQEPDIQAAGAARLHSRQQWQVPANCDMFICTKGSCF